jgi:GTP-binding protein LepA
LEQIIANVPSPKFSETKSETDFKSLIFDFKYSNHKGVIVFIRVFSGEVKKGDRLLFKVAGKEFQALEVGVFTPEEKPVTSLRAGEIGYIVTGIKEPGVASVGDTIVFSQNGYATEALTGYESARPVVWASVYPENQDNFNVLKQALMRLRLSDSAFSFEEESSGILGRGFRCGFLGMLHLEIITERLRREFNLPLVITLPSITYKVLYKNGKVDTIYTPSFFPEDHLISEVTEPWVKATVIIPPEYMSSVMQLIYEFEAELKETESMGAFRTALKFEMPLRQ